MEPIVGRGGQQMAMRRPKHPPAATHTQNAKPKNQQRRSKKTQMGGGGAWRGKENADHAMQHRGVKGGMLDAEYNMGNTTRGLEPVLHRCH